MRTTSLLLAIAFILVSCGADSSGRMKTAPVPDGIQNEVIAPVPQVDQN